VRKVLIDEVNLRSRGAEYVDRSQESTASLEYRRHICSEGVAAEAVSAGYRWHEGTELNTNAKGETVYG
jgi:hypothetical protein